jgi:carboxylate-amine ligase
MAAAAPSLTLGIEEEYLLVDRQSRDVVTDLPDGMLDQCEEQIADLVRPEFLTSQIEIGTPVCQNIKQARGELARLRRTVAGVAGRFGLAPMAASTHPFSEWTHQKHTDKQRYHVLARNMQGVARRLLICGMHVHVGIDDDELRIDLIVDILVDAGLIEDASMIWWDLRPSARFPTLEMRITDVCTSLDDAVAVAALWQCVVRMLYRLRRGNQRWRIYDPMLIDENRWRAKRYGIDDGLVDFGKGEVVPCADLLDELIELTREDASALDCVAEILHCRTIVARGTSAHRQLATYAAGLAAGAPPKQALRSVVDMLIEETVRDL